MGGPSNSGSDIGSFYCQLIRTTSYAIWSIGAAIVQIGGNAINGSNCGSFFCDLYDAVGISHWSIGAVLVQISDGNSSSDSNSGSCYCSLNDVIGNTFWHFGAVLVLRIAVVRTLVPIVVRFATTYAMQLVTSLGMMALDMCLAVIRVMFMIADHSVAI